MVDFECHGFDVKCPDGSDKTVGHQVEEERDSDHGIWATRHIEHVPYDDGHNCYVNPEDSQVEDHAEDANHRTVPLQRALETTR